MKSATLSTRFGVTSLSCDDYAGQRGAPDSLPHSPRLYTVIFYLLYLTYTHIYNGSIRQSTTTRPLRQEGDALVTPQELSWEGVECFGIKVIRHIRDMTGHPTLSFWMVIVVAM